MNRSSKINLYAIGQLLLGGLGLLIVLPTTVLSGGFGLMTALSGDPQSGSDSYSLLAVAWTGAAISLLLVPMLVNVIFDLLGRPRLSWRPRHSRKIATAGLLAWPVLLGLGSILSMQNWAWVMLPPLQVLIIGIPLWWLVETGMHFLKLERTSREWSMVGFSLLVTPLVLMVAEIVLLIAVVSGFIVWISSQPLLIIELQELSLRLMNANNDPEVVQRILTPYLQRPEITVVLLAIAAGVIPLLEELLKPMAVWLLIPRKITPREGFAMGMLSGAMFGLIESLASLSMPLDDLWPALVVGRLGTTLLHTVTTALVGWGIASAWTDRRWLRLVGAYLGAGALHGVWNAFALLMGLLPVLAPANAAFSGPFSGLVRFSPYILAALAAYMLFLFWRRSRSLGQEATQAAAEIVTIDDSLHAGESDGSQA